MNAVNSTRATTTADVVCSLLRAHVLIAWLSDAVAALVRVGPAPPDQVVWSAVTLLRSADAALGRDQPGCLPPTPRIPAVRALADELLITAEVFTPKLGDQTPPLAYFTTIKGRLDAAAYLLRAEAAYWPPPAREWARDLLHVCEAALTRRGGCMTTPPSAQAALTAATSALANLQHARYHPHSPLPREEYLR